MACSHQLLLVWGVRGEVLICWEITQFPFLCKIDKVTLSIGHSAAQCSGLLHPALKKVCMPLHHVGVYEHNTVRECHQHTMDLQSGSNVFFSDHILTAIATFWTLSSGMWPAGGHSITYICSNFYRNEWIGNSELQSLDWHNTEQCFLSCFVFELCWPRLPSAVPAHMVWSGPEGRFRHASNNPIRLRLNPRSDCASEATDRRWSEASSAPVLPHFCWQTCCNAHGCKAFVELPKYLDV